MSKHFIAIASLNVHKSDYTIIPTVLSPHLKMIPLLLLEYRGIKVELYRGFKDVNSTYPACYAGYAFYIMLPDGTFLFSPNIISRRAAINKACISIDTYYQNLN